MLIVICLILTSQYTMANKDPRKDEYEKESPQEESTDGDSTDVIDLEIEDIVIGKRFKSYDEAVKSMKKWCDKSYTPLILKGWNGDLSSGGEEYWPKQY